MPIYDYVCKTCGKEFEYKQRIVEDAMETNPAGVCDCEEGAGQVQRKISKNIGLVFNGSGFYLTDYVHNKKNNGNGNGSSKKTVSAATA